VHEELIYRKLGKVLWDIGGVEIGAATACGLMASTPFLTTREVDFVRHGKTSYARAFSCRFGLKERHSSTRAPLARAPSPSTRAITA